MVRLAKVSYGMLINHMNGMGLHVNGMHGITWDCVIDDYLWCCVYGGGQKLDADVVEIGGGVEGVGVEEGAGAVEGEVVAVVGGVE
jgi:hypothetical protein